MTFLSCIHQNLRKYLSINLYLPNVIMILVVDTGVVGVGISPLPRSPISPYASLDDRHIDKVVSIND